MPRTLGSQIKIERKPENQRLVTPIAFRVLKKDSESLNCLAEKWGMTYHQAARKIMQDFLASQFSISE